MAQAPGSCICATAGEAELLIARGIAEDVTATPRHIPTAQETIDSLSKPAKAKKRGK